MILLTRDMMIIIQSTTQAEVFLLYPAVGGHSGGEEGEGEVMGSNRLDIERLGVRRSDAY